MNESNRSMPGMDAGTPLPPAQIGMRRGSDLRKRTSFAAAARAHGVRRIIYLGGLGSGDSDRRSAHLRSRHDVGRILRESGVPTIELQSSIVLGSGSLSFEMIRALVERLPAMITPRWVNVTAQPIAIDDLLQVLIKALDLPLAESRVFEIGGAHGWYACDVLWRLRGHIELLLGGVGMRRGRPTSRRLRTGDTIDFWRVDTLEPGQRLRLSAEMKVPGRAWLEFEVVPREGGATIRQTAMFDPAELGGLLYWYHLFPIHGLIFSAMLRSMANAAERRQRATSRNAPAPS